MKKILILLLSIVTFVIVGFLFFTKGCKKSKIIQTSGKSKPRQVMRVSNSTQGKDKIDKERVAVKTDDLNHRQIRLLAVLSLDEPSAMGSIEKHFPEVNVRTLRRDLDKLQQKNLIKKMGSTKSALYQKL